MESNREGKSLSIFSNKDITENEEANDDKCLDGNEIDPNVDGFLKEIMLKNSLPWIPFNELKNIQNVYTDVVIIVNSAEWTYPHKSGVRIRKVRLDLLTGFADADSHEILLNEELYDCKPYDIQDVDQDYELLSFNQQKS
ncbi:14554_t:CDS:2 [Gigaspora margarita]|uniref:14554_t:CDS:1 n=1 Tax=Gigaspora margarita TaxID=4874 RepID=A0ABM8VYI1_GIGMA|nr:14554_t:CDS:2 [Gigaspora margarita]